MGSSTSASSTIANVLGANHPIPTDDYFATEPLMAAEPGTDDRRGPTIANDGWYQWQHPLSWVLTAVLGAGSRLELFHEWDFTLFEELTSLVKGVTAGVVGRVPARSRSCTP